MYTKVAVGEKYPLFSGEKYKGVNGAILEALDGDNGFWFNIMYDRPTLQEINIITQKKISMRLLRENEFVLPMIMFGNENCIFEMVFDPTVYGDGRAFQTKGKNNLLNIVLLDSSNGMVRGLRVANFPLKFIQICTEVWARACLIPDYSKKFSEWYRNLQVQDTKRLWMKAEYLGKLGEEYNIEDIYNRPDFSS